MLYILDVLDVWFYKRDNTGATARDGEGKSGRRVEADDWMTGTHVLSLN